MLTLETRQFLDKWQELNDEEHYYETVKSSLASLLAFTRAHFQTTYKNSYSKYHRDKIKGAKGARFDKLIDKIRMSVKNNISATYINQGTRSRRKNTDKMFKMTNHDKNINTKIDPRQMKLNFLKGKGNITNLFHPVDPHRASIYKNDFDGRTQELTKNVKEFFAGSKGTGHVIPDTTMMSLTESRMRLFKSQLQSFDKPNEVAQEICNMSKERLSTKYSRSARKHRRHKTANHMII